MTASGKGTLDLIGQILSNEMNVSMDRMFAQNQTQDLPQDGGLCVVLSFMYRKPYSVKVVYDIINGEYTEKQSVEMGEDVLISLISRNNDARDRAWEISAALKSTFSQQLQESEHIHISTIHDITDSSFMEATARLNRYDVRCRVIRGYNKSKVVSYYDKFYFNTWIKENGAISKYNKSIE